MVAQVIEAASADPIEILDGLVLIDFSMIIEKLQDPDEGAGWTLEYCERVRTEYLRYLALSRRYAQQAIVPSRIIDTFWHYHILDTQAYATDCEGAVGYFLHHFPYFGMRGAEDALALGDAYDETLRLYERHFGPPPNDLWTRSGMARCPNCGNRCK